MIWENITLGQLAGWLAILAGVIAIITKVVKWVIHAYKDIKGLIEKLYQPVKDLQDKNEEQDKEIKNIRSDYINLRAELKDNTNKMGDLHTKTEALTNNIDRLVNVWSDSSESDKAYQSEVRDSLVEFSEKLQKIADEQKLISNSVLADQRRSLLDNCERLLKQGWASMEEQQTISEQYNSYHALGGDSFITDKVNLVLKLPVAKVQSKSKSKKVIVE